MKVYLIKKIGVLKVYSFFRYLGEEYRCEKKTTPKSVSRADWGYTPGWRKLLSISHARCSSCDRRSTIGDLYTTTISRVRIHENLRLRTLSILKRGYGDVTRVKKHEADYLGTQNHSKIARECLRINIFQIQFHTYHYVN